MVNRKSIEELLADSIKELMNKKPLQKITVRMIAENCQVTRQTFYRYFPDKYALVNWIFRTNIDNIVRNSSRELPWSHVLAQMLISMKEDQKFYVNAMNYEGQNSFHQFITEYTRVAYEKELCNRLDPSLIDDKVRFSLQFNSYGAVGSIYNWIKGNMAEDPYLLAKNIAENMPQNMKIHFN